MNKIVLLSMTLFFASSLMAQNIEVPMNNQPLIVKYTADWCPNCGNWGWTLFENLLADNREDALLLAAHYSGNQRNLIASTWYDNDNAFYQPVFFLNGQNQNAQSNNIAAVRTSTRAAVEQTNQEMPVVQAGLRAEVDDTYGLYISWKAKFFQPAQGEYFLGVYLVEKDYFGYQASQGNNAHHKQMLRLAYGPAGDGLPFGEMLASGDISEGSEYEGTYIIEGTRVYAAIEKLDEILYNDGLEVAVIIWKLESGKYVPVNTNRSGVNILSSTQEVAGLSSFRISPAATADEAVIQLKLDTPVTPAVLSLHAANGAHLRTLHQGNLTAGLHQFSLPKQGLPAGQYFVRLAGKTGVSSQPVIFQ